MALIIGSTALHELFPSEVRAPKDLDYLGDENVIPRGIASITSPVESFWDNSWNGTQLDRNGFATLDELYTIKVSHAYWIIGNSWDKHMADLNWMKSKGAQLDMELHKILYAVWVAKHGRKQMNLSQAAGNFFDDAVKREFDHDSIHDSVAFGDRPLYERILKDGETVDIDPDKMWNGLSFDEQVLLFREEIAATALERWMLPSKYHFSAGLAYKMALKKTITSLTKGRSARFIVTNFEHFMKPHDYMAIHHSKSHLLRPFVKNAMM